jgi:rubrerythrin
MFRLQDILDLAIRLEKNGEAVYRNACRYTGNRTLNQLLEATAEEEVKHARWFSSLKRNLQTDPDYPLLKEINDTLIDEFVGDQVFSLKEVDFSKVKSTKEMIAIFIEFENDTILFYQMLQSFITDDDTSNAIDMIINEEKQHIERFKEKQHA